MGLEWDAGSVKTQEGEQEEMEREGFQREAFTEQKKGHGP